jgi:hypothetical protein
VATRASDIEKLLRHAETQGWRIEARKKCFIAFPPLDAPDPKPVSIPKSPNGIRMIQNVTSALRRGGFNPDTDRHEAVTTAIESGHRDIVPSSRTNPPPTREQVEVRLNGAPLVANGRPVNGAHKAPVTVITREPVPGRPGIEQVLLSDGAEVFGCAICPDLRARTASEAANHHHHNHTMNRGRDGEPAPAGTLIAAILRDEIVTGSGGWTYGQNMPTGRDLAARFGVSGFTISQAFKPLIAEGLVSTQAGHRAVVTYKPAPALAVTPEPTMPTPPTPALLAGSVRPVTAPAKPTPPARPAATAPDPQAEILKVIGQLRDIAGQLDDGGASAAQAAELRRQVAQSNAERDSALAKANAATTRADKAEKELEALKGALKVIQSL